MLNINNNNNVAFKGFWGHQYVTRALRPLENTAIKYTFLSIGAVSIPRVYVDYTRNTEMGFETARYEAGGTFINYLLPGALALGLAKVAEKFKEPKGIFTSFWADNESISELHKNWQKHGNREGFFRTTLEEIRNHSGEKLDNNVFSQAQKALEDLTKPGKISSKERKEALEVIKTTIGNALGARDSIRLEGHITKDFFGKLKPYTTSVDKLVDNMYNLSKEIFPHGEDAIKKLKWANNFKTFGALGIAGALTFSLQFINRAITKQRTGIDGYIGYSDLQGEIDKRRKLKNTQNVSFKGYGFDSPYLNNSQIRWYMAPVHITGTLFASRDNNELIERSIKAGFWFANIFFIPGFAAKLVAYGLKNKNHILTKPATLKNLWNNGIKSYKELEAYSAKTGTSLKPLMRVKNITKLAELAYAMLAVGFGVQYISKNITEYRRKKDLEQKQKLHSSNSLLKNNFDIIEKMNKNTSFSRFFRERVK